MSGEEGQCSRGRAASGGGRGVRGGGRGLSDREREFEGGEGSKRWG